MCQSCKSGGPPQAAWLSRVSTPGQEYLSPESQLAAIPWLEAQGYSVPKKYVLNFVWTSQELLDCPDIRDRLIPWIEREEVHAVGMLHSDRLAGAPDSFMYIFGLAAKHNVKLLAGIIGYPGAGVTPQ